MNYIDKTFGRDISDDDENGLFVETLKQQVRDVRRIGVNSVVTSIAHVAQHATMAGLVAAINFVRTEENIPRKLRRKLEQRLEHFLVDKLRGIAIPIQPLPCFSTRVVDVGAHVRQWQWIEETQSHILETIWPGLDIFEVGIVVIDANLRPLSEVITMDNIALQPSPKIFRIWPGCSTRLERELRVSINLDEVAQHYYNYRYLAMVVGPVFDSCFSVEKIYCTLLANESESQREEEIVTPDVAIPFRPDCSGLIPLIIDGIEKKILWSTAEIALPTVAEEFAATVKQIIRFQVSAMTYGELLTMWARAHYSETVPTPAQSHHIETLQRFLKI